MSNDQAVRLGIQARSSFNAVSTHIIGVTASWQAQSRATINAALGHPANVLINAGGTPFSTSYGVTGKFSGFSEILEVIGGSSLTYLIKTNDLEVSGFGIEVTAPGSVGGFTELQYSGGNLVKVIYGDGSVKDLNYTADRLTSTVETSAARTVTKTLSYNPTGTLIGITQVEA